MPADANYYGDVFGGWLCRDERDGSGGQQRGLP